MKTAKMIRYRSAKRNATVDDKRRELAAIRVSMLNASFSYLVEREKIVFLEFNDLLLAEESFFKQKV